VILCRKVHKLLIINALCIGFSVFCQAQKANDANPSVGDGFEDPLAPILSPGRSAISPQEVNSTDDWSLQDMVLGYGYVGSASLNKGFGTVTEQAAELSLIASRRVDNQVSFLLGGNWQTFSFGYNGSNIPLPNNLQALNAILGCDIDLDDSSESKWALHMEIDPGVYGTWQSLGWHQVNVPGVIAISQIYKDDFQWFFALRADVFQFFPIIPVPGLRWRFGDRNEWVLNGSAPKPTLRWQPWKDGAEYFSDLTLYAGGDILNINARLPASDAKSLGGRSLSGALVNYFEGRAGAGVEYQVTPELALQLEGGAVVWRSFDFFRLNDQVTSTMAPYVQATIRGQF